MPDWNTRLEVKLGDTDDLADHELLADLQRAAHGAAQHRGRQRRLRPPAVHLHVHDDDAGDRHRGRRPDRARPQRAGVRDRGRREGGHRLGVQGAEVPALLVTSAAPSNVVIDGVPQANFNCMALTSASRSDDGRRRRRRCGRRRASSAPASRWCTRASTSCPHRAPRRSSRRADLGAAGGPAEVHYWFPVQIEVVGLDDADSGGVVAARVRRAPTGAGELGVIGVSVISQSANPPGADRSGAAVRRAVAWSSPTATRSSAILGSKFVAGAGSRPPRRSRSRRSSSARNGCCSRRLLETLALATRWAAAAAAPRSPSPASRWSPGMTVSHGHADHRPEVHPQRSAKREALDVSITLVHVPRSAPSVTSPARPSTSRSPSPPRCTSPPPPNPVTPNPVESGPDRPAPLGGGSRDRTLPDAADRTASLPPLPVDPDEGFPQSFLLALDERTYRVELYVNVAPSSCLPARPATRDVIDLVGATGDRPAAVRRDCWSARSPGRTADGDVGPLLRRRLLPGLLYTAASCCSPSTRCARGGQPQRRGRFGSVLDRQGGAAMSGFVLWHKIVISEVAADGGGALRGGRLRVRLRPAADRSATTSTGSAWCSTPT